MREGYKKTEIGVFPVEWGIAKLSDLTDVRDGTHDSPKYVDEGIPFVTSKNLKENGIDFADISYITQEDHEKIQQRSRVDDGDILFAMIGTIGNPVIVMKAFDFSIKNVALIKFNGNQIINRYVLNLLKSSIIQKQFDRKSNGGVQKFVSLGMIRNLLIPLPNIKEQQKIADILSTVDEQIEQTEALIEKTKELKKGLIQRLLTKGIGHTEFIKTEIGEIPIEWEIKKLGDVIVSCSNGTTEKQNPNRRGVMVTRIETISDGKVDLNKVGYVDSDSDLLQYKLQIGDILFSHINSVKHIGKVALIDRDYDLYHGMNLINIRCDHNIMDYRFLFYTLSSYRIKEYFEASCKQAINQASLNQKDIKQCIIAMPNNQEQREIGCIIQKTDDYIAQRELEKQKLNDLKKSLMQQLLTGKIRVKGS